MSKNNPIAIVGSGGGMKSAHGAGFLYVLATKFGITTPDIMVGSSGDAGNTLYFSAGQYESLKRIWTELLSAPKFISYFRFWRVMDIDYLVDTVFKNQERLDINKLRSSPIRWSVPISDFDTGHTRYINADDKIDLFEVLRATTAIPFAFGKKISIGKKRYIDGEFGPVLQDHVTHVLNQGAKKILILNHTSPWNHISQAVFRGYAAHIPQGMHDAIIRDISTNVFQMSAPNASVIAVAPQDLPAGNLTRNQNKLKKTFEQGMEDALKIEKELRTFFSSPQNHK